MIALLNMLSGCASSSNTASKDDKTSESSENVKDDNASGNLSGQETEILTPDKNGTSSQITFEAQDINGNTVSADVFSGTKLTMVNVWATYCNPCLNEMPELGELAKEYDVGDFQLIGIISDVPEGAEQEYLEQASYLIKQTGADYPHLLLNESLYNALLTGVSAVPTTFFIDENGTVLDTVIGAQDKSGWREKIDGLLEEQ